MTDRGDIEALVDTTADSFGTVDILVNNAQSSTQGRIETITDADVARTMESGPIATLRCMQACLPHMRQHGGVIINLGSSTAVQGDTGFGAYAMAKEAIRGLTKVAAHEWGRYGITVNVVCPAADSPASEAFFAAPSGAPRALPAGVTSRAIRPQRGGHRPCLRRTRQRRPVVPHRCHADAGRRTLHPALI